MNRQQSNAATQVSHGFAGLARKTFDELDNVFRTAFAPQDLTVLGASPAGRGLAIRGLDRGLAGVVLRATNGWRYAYWAGKAITSDNDGRAGTGSNIDRFGRELVPFTLRFGPSVIDGKEALIFDYDHASNSRITRRLYNELRQISPGIFLGSVNWQTNGRYRQLAWFALDASRQLRKA
ncbi:hypothetical protein PP299_14445 [Mycobacteroides abscessus]|nr:hypothetical protein [Mycobacteroides abscessus]MDM1906717.1 hypothetical protein [Mycobacteroides abscessus]MDM1911402.1 hypothetical protein [Mycobacteroides abscessus]MDM1921270.1 hypothetical protein [Mycobacteroides abscessus]